MRHTNTERFRIVVCHYLLLCVCVFTSLLASLVLRVVGGSPKQRRSDKLGLVMQRGSQDPSYPPPLERCWALPMVVVDGEYRGRLRVRGVELVARC